MPITPDQRQRLDRIMNARRLELGITWRDVAGRAGISYESLRALRTGPGGIRDLTAAKIARALQWTSSSVERVIEGGDPEEVAGSGQAGPPRVVQDNWDDENVRVLWRLSVTEDQRLSLIEAYLAGLPAPRRASNA